MSYTLVRIKMLEPEKQQFLIDHLAASANDFEAAISNADPARWSTRTAPDRWSIAEIAEHILILDTRVATLASTIQEWPEEPYDAEHSARKDQLILTIAENRETRISAPPTVLPTGSLASATEFYPGFHKSQEALIRAVRENPQLLRGRFREHPLLKKLDGYQWLLVCSCHRRRHLSQIQEVARDLEAQPFPA